MQFFFLPILSVQVSVSQDLERNKTFEIAKSFVGTKEVGRNSGYWVDKFLKNVNLKPGAEWCGAFVAFCLDSAKVKSFKVRSGLARRYVTKNSIKATEVIQKNIMIPKGSLVVWRRGNTIFGHVGIVDQWQGKNGTTVEGNTTSGKQGVQYAGNGVYARKRSIYPLNFFRITDFTIYGK